MSKEPKNPPTDIESLNADDLDIEELERRIELAGLTADPMGWLCGADCGNNCVGNVCVLDGGGGGGGGGGGDTPIEN